MQMLAVVGVVSPKAVTHGKHPASPDISIVVSGFSRTAVSVARPRRNRIESRDRVPGPVREQPTLVLGKKHLSRMTPPRPSGRPLAATRSAFDSLTRNAIPFERNVRLEPLRR